MIQAFNDIKRSSLPKKEGVAGQPYLDNLLALQVGHGNTSMKSNRYGLWLGAKNYNDAPFYVDMNGNAVATSISVSGYIPTGGALSDIGSLGITETYIASNAISSPKIQANAITAGKISANAVEADKIASNAVTAGKIATNAVTADKILAGAVTATKINVSSLDAISATLGDVEVGGSSDALGTIVVKNSSGIEITKLNRSGVIVRNTRGLFFEETTSGNYASLQVNSANQMVIQMPETTNAFLIRSTSNGVTWNTNEFTVSKTAVFSNQALSVNAAVTCKELLLNYGQNEGSIRNVNSIEGYNDLQLYGNGTIRLYPGGSKVWFDKNIDLNEKDLDAGNTLWAYSFSNRSDRRLKKQIKRLPPSLIKINKLNPVSFKWKKNNESDFGLIAQHTYKYIPEVVKKADDGYLSIDYISLIPYIIKAIQELYSMQTGKDIIIDESETDEKFFKRTKSQIKIESERKSNKYGSEKRKKKNAKIRA